MNTIAAANNSARRLLIWFCMAATALVLIAALLAPQTEADFGDHGKPGQHGNARAKGKGRPFVSPSCPEGGACP